MISLCLTEIFYWSCINYI